MPVACGVFCQSVGKASTASGVICAALAGCDKHGPIMACCGFGGRVSRIFSLVLLTHQRRVGIFAFADVAGAGGYVVWCSSCCSLVDLRAQQQVLKRAGIDEDTRFAVV